VCVREAALGEFGDDFVEEFVEILSTGRVFEKDGFVDIHDEG
jgi:hypothetical protein